VQTRLDQIDELCCFIKEVIDSSNITPDTTIILTGDLNVDAHNYHKKRQVKIKSKFPLYLNFLIF
jgi:menaquinone-dependent protoporphyrinogen IX oxidase